jgi:hypothetical protein
MPQLHEATALSAVVAFHKLEWPSRQRLVEAARKDSGERLFAEIEERSQGSVAADATAVDAAKVSHWRRKVGGRARVR